MMNQRIEQGSPFSDKPSRKHIHFLSFTSSQSEGASAVSQSCFSHLDVQVDEESTKVPAKRCEHQGTAPEFPPRKMELLLTLRQIRGKRKVQVIQVSEKSISWGVTKLL